MPPSRVRASTGGRGKKLKRDVAINVVGAVTRTAALLLIVRLATVSFTPVALGAFLLSRRIASTAANLLHLGMPQTLQRHIPMTGSDAESRFVLVSLASVVGLLILVVVTLLAGLWQEFGGTFVFPSYDNGPRLMFWTALLIAATVLHFVAYVTLLAHRWMIVANILELAGVSGFLLVAFLLARDSTTPSAVLRFQTFGMLILSTSVIVSYLACHLPSCWPNHAVWARSASTYIRFGLPRSVISFLDMALLLIGPWLLREDMDQAGAWIIALTVVRVIQLMMTPATQVAGVVTAHLLGKDDEESIGEGVRLMFGTVAYGAVLASAAILPWTDTLMPYWLGSEQIAHTAADHLRILALAIVPLSIFYSLKGIVEMRWNRPRNLFTLVAAVGVHLLLWTALNSTIGYIPAARLSATTSFCLTGVLTIWGVRHYLGTIGFWGFPRLAFVAALVATTNTLLAKTYGIVAFGPGLALDVALIVLLLIFVNPPEFVRSLRGFIYAG